jgi:hypothetical protein
MSKSNSSAEIDLPKRKWSRDLASIEALTRGQGGGDAEVAQNAKVHAYAEWSEDLDWIAGERQRLGLSQGQCDELAARFRERNRLAWGAHSWTPD